MVEGLWPFFFNADRILLEKQKTIVITLQQDVPRLEFWLEFCGVEYQ